MVPVRPRPPSHGQLTIGDDRDSDERRIVDRFGAVVLVALVFSIAVVAVLIIILH